MLSLPDVTLIIVDCLDAHRAAAVLKQCTDLVSFGAVKLLTSKETDSPYKVKIPPINNLTEYSDFIIKHLYEYIDTPFMQIVQHDGWILNPESWENDWMRYDYIAPLFRQEMSVNNDSVGAGGFSFRSRKLMKFIAENCHYGDEWYGYIHEDGVICHSFKAILNNAGFVFAPPDRAAKYAAGGNPYCFCNKPYGFHGLWSLPPLNQSLTNIYAHYTSTEPGYGDKGTIHSYIEIYEALLAPYRGCKNVLEIGIGKGHGLKMWKEYFKDAKVYGANKTFEGIEPLVTDGTYNIAVLNTFIKSDVDTVYSGIKFDVIIEDTSHILDHSLKIYENFKDKVAPGGIYIIEDADNIDATGAIFKKIDMDKAVQIIDRRHVKGRFDDVLVVIRDPTPDDINASVKFLTVIDEESNKKKWYEYIDAKFNSLFSVISDMQEHIKTLYGYAVLSKRIIEFGVDDCTSSWMLLAGKPEWMRSYDIIRKPEVDEVEIAAKNAKIDFKFINQSTLDMVIEECDLLLIDSLHTYEQLSKELSIHAGKVKKWIILHDTEIFGHIDQDARGKGLVPAIEEFLASHKEWRIKEKSTNCYGLTVLERI